MAIDNQLRNIDLFSELSVKELKSIDALMTTVPTKAGKNLIVEGTAGREFMIILEGEATVRRGGKVLARLGAGDFMGELALVAGVPRTATVTADTDMKLSVLSRREFTSLLDSQPKLARKILVGAVKRVYDLDPAMVK